MLTKDEAICIRTVDYSETSQIVTLFTKTSGKVGAIAKGSKRPKSPFDGPIEMFAYGKIVFSDSSREKLATLTEFQQHSTFANLNRSIYVFNCCLFAAELANLLTKEYDPHPGLFDSLLLFLRKADERRETRQDRRDVLALLTLFQLALLKEVGLSPVLDMCVNCKKQFQIGRSHTWFSSSANGLICRDCEASFPDKLLLAKDAANCLANAKLIVAADEKTLMEIEKLLISHFSYTLGRPPKMAKHILKR
jgi:DNA repair protein RecO (recombination protein O)